MAFEGIGGGRRLVIIAATVVALLAVMMVIGQESGKAAAMRNVARLDADLGFSVMGLPQPARALVAILALDCDLVSKPPGRIETLACLRSAASSRAADDQMLPNAAGRLESVLSIKTDRK
ncbi:hypothetical protein [Acidovorax sp. sic0104]|uniref:hypothetical protein n=1 Tax=Acidovorax sp. sic0104 TaxID=2854784 RepID=UPI001C497903|nr:hypothetical protein [Acidovorax sp. sic0104]MBV7541928.1 hypothetical protein [Acidovorax sp. sic0104]